MSNERYADARYISLETFKRDGSGVKTPVWCAPLDGQIVVFTEAKAFKVKRLRRNPKIRMARCDVRGKVRGTWSSGTGRIADSQFEQDLAYAALQKKVWLADARHRLLLHSIGAHQRSRSPDSHSESRVA